MLSLKRWYIQTLTDEFKQQCIHVLQGLDPLSQNDQVEEFIKETRFARQSLNVEHARVSIKIATLNANHEVPQTVDDLVSLISPGNTDNRPGKLADIYVIAV